MLEVFMAWRCFFIYTRKTEEQKLTCEVYGPLRLLRAFCGLVTCDAVITSQNVLLNSGSKEQSETSSL